MGGVIGLNGLNGLRENFAKDQITNECDWIRCMLNIDGWILMNANM